MTRMLRLYPRRWRRRFGPEVDEMLLRSRRRMVDRVNLVLAAPGVWVTEINRDEQKMKTLRLVQLGLAFVMGAGTALTAVALVALQNGPRELSEHWWSGAPVALTALATLALMMTLRAEHQRVA